MEAPKDPYAYTDNITINATVKASGIAPAMLTATFDEPQAGQVTVYKGDAQVCDPQTPDADGACSFTILAKDLGPGSHTLTVKYKESTVMAEAMLTVNVKVDECTHPTMDSSNKCTDCGETIVVQVDGTNYTDFAAAWNAATANAGEATLSIISSPVIYAISLRTRSTKGMRFCRNTTPPISSVKGR